MQSFDSLLRRCWNFSAISEGKGNTICRSSRRYFRIIRGVHMMRWAEIRNRCCVDSMGIAHAVHTAPIYYQFTLPIKKFTKLISAPTCTSYNARSNGTSHDVSIFYPIACCSPNRNWLIGLQHFTHGNCWHLNSNWKHNWIYLWFRHFFNSRLHSRYWQWQHLLRHKCQTSLSLARGYFIR